MALLFMDGFEHYVSADVGEKYSYVSSAQVSSTRARTGTYSLYGGELGVSLGNASGATVIVGMGIYATTGGFRSTVGMGGFASSSFAQATLVVQSDGAISVTRGLWTGTELGRTAAGVFRFNVWNYIEVKVLLHDSTGAVTVMLNGATVLTLTNQDTIGNPAVATWNVVEIDPGTSSWIDDLYVCDGSGSENNDFLGECRVVTLLPSTGNGSNTDFTCSSSTDHGALVDEAAPNDDTDYVYSSTVNHVDSWNYPALGYTGTIKGVQMSLSAKKTDSGTRAIAAVTRPASTNRVHGTDHYLGTSYAYWMALWELNPEDSAAWEVADIDGAEFGVKVTV